jgi:RecA/RadA recombinase
VQSEGGLDKDWAERCGLPIDATAVSDTIEELASALELTIRILKESKPRCLIFDSLSALPGDSKKAVGDSKSHGERAKPMNDFFRKLNGAIDKQEPPLLLFIEHLHPNIGGYGYITTGGETKGYMSVVEMRFRRTGSLVQLMETDVGEAELPIELTTAWELRKSKVSPDGGRGEFNLGLRDMEGIVAGEINDFNETLALATYLGIVQKKGAWFQIGEDKYHGLQGVRRELTTSALKQIIVEAGEAGGKETGKKSKGKGNTK